MKSASFTLLSTLFMVACLSSCAQIKDAGTKIGHATRDATKEIGHASRDAAKAVSHKTKEVVSDIKE
ncbi:hypothetical protein ACFOD0_05310 [Shewanella intestini]|uniref:Lipoprotein n=1 Tax=Shewanella intestini TaxID=2017544 RepID=A0ABS5I125_9GAMM|nr:MULTISPECIES: hypothetical protein [Shewanella]MBR9727719.1 hypothetical protein [Shewanella intestini]MRG35131.1 hypothetical protein [Shewanella sp. XMDDZSB0408]